MNFSQGLATCFMMMLFGEHISLGLGHYTSFGNQQQRESPSTKVSNTDRFILCQ